MDGFDFSTVEVNHESVMVVKHPKTGDPTPASITLAGPEHPKHKAVVLAAQRAVRKSFAKTGRFVPNDPIDDAENEIDKAVTCTLGWKGVMKDGKALDCTAQNARDIYEGAPWLKDQVIAFLGNGENFISSAETN
jgi:hypothetical protein